MAVIMFLSPLRRIVESICLPGLYCSLIEGGKGDLYKLLMGEGKKTETLLTGESINGQQVHVFSPPKYLSPDKPQIHIMGDQLLFPMTISDPLDQKGEIARMSFAEIPQPMQEKIQELAVVSEVVRHCLQGKINIAEVVFADSGAPYSKSYKLSAYSPESLVNIIAKTIVLMFLGDMDHQIEIDPSSGKIITANNIEIEKQADGDFRYYMYDTGGICFYVPSKEQYVPMLRKEDFADETIQSFLMDYYDDFVEKGFDGQGEKYEYKKNLQKKVLQILRTIMQDDRAATMYSKGYGVLEKKVEYAKQCLQHYIQNELPKIIGHLASGEGTKENATG